MNSLLHITQDFHFISLPNTCLITDSTTLSRSTTALINLLGVMIGGVLIIAYHFLSLGHRWHVFARGVQLLFRFSHISDVEQGCQVPFRLEAVNGCANVSEQFRLISLKRHGSTHGIVFKHSPRIVSSRRYYQEVISLTNQPWWDFKSWISWSKC